MGLSRRRARQTAFQVLYQLDITKDSVEHALENPIENSGLDQPDQEFAHLLVRGVYQHLPEIDTLLERFTKDWSIERMTLVDRNIMRLALYEITQLGDVPVSVSVNEAVELAKNFSDDTAAKFINGVLGSVVDYIATELSKHE